MSSRLLSRGLSSGDAIGLLTRGLIRPDRLIIPRRRKLRGNIVFSKPGGNMTVAAKLKGQVWKGK